MWRRPDAIVHAQFWAEDGKIFFEGALYRGLSSLWQPYGGYFHLYPRIVAWLCEASPLPYRYFPLAYNLAWLAGMALCIVCIWRLRTLSAGVRFALSLLLTLIPAGNEVMINLTNAQWILAAWILIYSMNEPSDSVLTNVAGYLLLAVSGLTTPMSIVFPALFLPAVFRYGSQQKYHHFINLAVIVITGGLQLTGLLGGSGRLHSTISEHTVNWLDIRFLKLVKDQYVYIFTGNTRLLSEAAYTIPLFLPVAALLIVTGIAALRKKSGIAFSFFLGGLLTLGAVMFESRHFLSDLHPFHAGTRYFYIPAYAFVCCLLVLADRPAPRFRMLQLALVLWMGVVTFTAFRPFRFPDKQWEKHARIMEEGGPVVVPVNPDPWTITFERRRDPGEGSTEGRVPK